MVYPISVLFFCNKKYPTNIIKDRIPEWIKSRRREKNIHALKICDFAATTDSDGEVYIYLTKDEQTKNH
jgi:predicted house-cleaning noncanonical NTP pyrophosphatase (MazG superfamily)